jgi:large subunit ribosomal protein L16
MLMPSRTKFRKVRKGRIHGGTASAMSSIAYGRYGLVSLESERITARQIEAARQAMTRYVKRGGQIWIRVFPHTPVTRKPQDVKMGSGKGNPEFFVAEDVAREAMRLAGHKLPVKTRFSVKEEQ